MAGPYGPFAPAQIDFSWLSKLPDQFEKGAQYGRDRQFRKTAANIDPNDHQAMVKALMQADPALGTKYALAVAEQQATQAYRQADLGYRRDALNQPPDVVRTAQAVKADPSLTAAITGSRPQSATDKRALYAAQDELPDIESTIEALTRAEEINDKTLTGLGASARGYLGSKLPDWAVPDAVAEPKASTYTNEWEIITSQGALEKMSATLKGQTSNLELQEYISKLADPSTPAPTRKSIIQRLKVLAERKRDTMKSRIGDLGGEVADPGEPPPSAGGGEFDFRDYDPRR